jgi:HSP20 family protein
VKKEAIKAELRDRVLTLSGSRQDDAPKDASLLRKESPSGEFVRALTLPVPVEGDKIEAHFKDGILTLRMPKAESARSRSIAITA